MDYYTKAVVVLLIFIIFLTVMGLTSRAIDKVKMYIILLFVCNILLASIQYMVTL